MDRKKISPYAIAAAINAHLTGHTSFAVEGYGNGLKEQEAAVKAWDRFVRAHVPGLKFSDRPRYILVPRDHTWKGRHLDVSDTMVNLDGMELDGSRWEEIATYLHRLPWYDDGERDLVPKGWKYSAIAPAKDDHSEHDEPNPRLYNLKGYMVRQAFDINPKSWADSFVATFAGRLCRAFDGTARNDRRGMVWARLQHHLEHGGNPEAFREFVGVLADGWATSPPLITRRTRVLEQALPEALKDAPLLVKYIREWVEATKKKRPSRKERDLEHKGLVIANDPLFVAADFRYHRADEQRLVDLLRGRAQGTSITFKGSQAELGRWLGRHLADNRFQVSSKVELAKWAAANMKYMKNGNPTRINPGSNGMYDSLTRSIGHMVNDNRPRLNNR
jgi:hypothetical protein